jgi:hypothetical protein
MSNNIEALIASIKPDLVMLCDSEELTAERREALSRIVEHLTPPNLLALIAALEQAKQEKAELVNFYENSLCLLLPDCRYMDPPDGGNVTPLAQVQRMVADYQQRIAELEAAAVKPVKLPPVFWYEHDDLSRDVPVMDARKVKKAIRAAGGSVVGSE